MLETTIKSLVALAAVVMLAALWVFGYVHD